MFDIKKRDYQDQPILLVFPLAIVVSLAFSLQIQELVFYKVCISNNTTMK